MLTLTLALALSSAPTLVPKDDLPIERWSMQQLRREQRVLDETKPPLLGAIFMVTSGGVLLGAGGYFGLFALLGEFGGLSLGNAMVTLGLVLGGTGFLTGGLYYLRTIRAERASYDERIQAIDEEIDRRRGGTVTLATF